MFSSISSKNSREWPRSQPNLAKSNIQCLTSRRRVIKPQKRSLWTRSWGTIQMSLMIKTVAPAVSDTLQSSLVSNWTTSQVSSRVILLATRRSIRRTSQARWLAAKIWKILIFININIKYVISQKHSPPQFILMSHLNSLSNHPHWRHMAWKYSPLII